jgi:hypothetical protein
VTYADLYRRTKIQEAVYEALTQQYELAKVQEVRETPSVKVLDAAAVPERKSFPPRTLIVYLCVSLALFGSAFSVVTHTHWKQMPSNDPGKVFTQEVFQSMNALMPWTTPNGSRLQATTHRVWIRLVRRGASAEARDPRSN